RGAVRAPAHVHHRQLELPQPHRPGPRLARLPTLAQRQQPSPRRPGRPTPRTRPRPQRTPPTLGPPTRNPSRLTNPAIPSGNVRTLLVRPCDGVAVALLDSLCRGPGESLRLRLRRGDRQVREPVEECGKAEAELFVRVEPAGDGGSPRPEVGDPQERASRA